MSRSPLLAVVIFLSVLTTSSGLVAAQERAAASPAAMARCLAAAHRAFRTLERLLGEARSQHDASRAGSPERNAAEASIERIAQRALRTAERASACIRQHAPRLPVDLRVPGALQGAPPHRDASGRIVVEVEAPPDPRERAVAEDRDEAVRLVTRGISLAPLVHLERIERVDGTGDIPRDALLDAARRLGPAIDRCYEALLERRGLQRGAALLAIVLEQSGKLRRARVERVELGGAGFRRCLRDAVRTFRPATRPRGGWVGYQLTVHFGEHDATE